MKLFGKNPVIERIKTNPQSIKKIYLQENHSEGGYIRKKAQKWGIPVYSVVRSKMLKLSRTLNTQGILAEIEDFSYVPFDDLLEAAKKKGRVLLFLDSLTDPQNLGVIMRSAACLGGFSIVLPKRESVSVTEAVLRVASGGENFIEVALVNNLGRAIDKTKEEGFWIAGAVPEEGKSLTQNSLSFPLALVIGSEQKGIREGIRRRLDFKMTIPMRQRRLTLNAAQAATIFCYEITRQKEKYKIEK